ncbi:VacJ family lipoprotein [Paralimibaculum aggregatum]|uniref:VacJ family lipoprotein n=1 Tax=Paralimibaculum aggregatum TaxID=3036245 RepID=A0ABQ6LEA1_9RHOB|nr:VacJ family lipoprotein [Limibaculum sp. NKW23]GMG81297.1 VacJ family lipoprotein [Limibaculum sp. NKW23]
MRLSHTVRSVTAMAAVLTLAACASPGPGASFDERDPYRATNEAIHDFNIEADRYVLRPVSQAYDTVTPEIIQFLLTNAFNHLDTVNDFANYLLQGDIEAAGTAFGRLTMNTVLGAGGLLDPATEFGLPKEDTDFGVTLGKYGVAEGAYLVLPLLGPSTTRDVGGAMGDIALNPLTYTGFFNSNALDVFSPVYNGAEIVHDRARNADLIDDVLYNSENSYISLRTIYLQRRDSLILGDQVEDTLPDIFDDEPVN